MNQNIENTKELKMIGVDVAKDKLDVAFADNTVITVNNNEAGFKKILGKLPSTDDICFVMEASGGYEKSFADFLLKENIAVAIVNAKRVRDFAKAMGMSNPTSDRIANCIDSAICANCLCTKEIAYS